MAERAADGVSSSGAVSVGLDGGSEEMAVALAAANMGTWRWTIATDEVKVSGSLLDLYGLGANTFSGKFSELFTPVHPEDLAGVRKAVKNAIEQHIPYECQFRVILPAGHIRWLMERGQPVYDESGTPLRMTGAVIDITDRVEAQEALAARERQLNAVIEGSLDAIVVIDENDRVLEWNQAAERMFGWSKEEALGCIVSDMIIPTSYRERHKQGVARFKATKIGPNLNQRLELSALRRDGREFPIEVALSHIVMEDGHSIFSASIKDISKRKEAEERLRQSQERLTFTLDAAEAGVWEADVATGSFWMSGLAAERYGWPPEETVRSFKEVFGRMHPEDRQRVQERYANITSGGQGTGVQYRVVWPDGQVRWLLSRGKAVLDSQGQYNKVFGITLDITESKEIEEALRQSEEYFRLLIESMTDYAVIVLSPEGKIESWNKGAEDMYGYRAEDVLGRDLTFTMPPDEQSQLQGATQETLDIARKEGRATLHRWAVRKDGSRFFGTGVTFPLWKGKQLRGYVKVIRDETQQREAEEKLTYLANHDPLTGLPNRTALSNRLHIEIARARREDEFLAFMMLDLDRFKTVNDTLGHHIGDLLLKEVAIRLLTSVRETDVVTRFGGDEFVVLAGGLTSVDDAKRLAQKIVADMGRPFLLDGTEVQSGTSIGIALYPQDATESLNLMKYADLALYQAKEKGRHNYQLFSQELYASALKRASMEEGLRHALANNEFKLLYQPIVDLTTSEVYGVEALLRWETSHRQVLSPEDFMAVAEETGLIVVIGEWTLREACKDAVAFQQRGISPFRLAVNFSARQLKEPGFPQMIQRVLKETGLGPELLELDLTESLIMNEANETILQELKDQGVRVVIDDFGTGLSALSYIRDIAIDGIKIDKTFIDHVAHSRNDNAIVGAAISLARSLGIRVIAEGVETLEQLAFLKNQGCTSAQGFLFSEPIEPKKLEEWLREDHWPRGDPD